MFGVDIDNAFDIPPYPSFQLFFCDGVCLFYGFGVKGQAPDACRVDLEPTFTFA